MEDVDYESLPAASSVSSHMVAGAAAGIMEHCIMYPVDCVKTRMMSLVPDPRANYKNVPEALYKIVRYEGMRNTVRGINAVVGGAGPAHALYFACYEKLKKTISGTKQGTVLANGVAGSAATLIHDAVMNPADVIKQRMQMYNSPYKTCTECIRTTLEREGHRAFYRSYTTQLTMNIPFQSIHFIIYEAMQNMINMERHYDPATHMISGAMAGGVAAAITNPLDVCKTLLNTQERCATERGGAISGLGAACRTIYEFRGISGFAKGVSARVIYQMPSTAISWSVYEFFKYFLNKKQSVDCDGIATVHVHASTR